MDLGSLSLAGIRLTVNLGSMAGSLRSAVTGLGRHSSFNSMPSLLDREPWHDQSRTLAEHQYMIRRICLMVLSACSSFGVDLAQYQARKGSVPTSKRLRKYIGEERRCERIETKNTRALYPSNKQRPAPPQGALDRRLSRQPDVLPNAALAAWLV